MNFKSRGHCATALFLQAPPLGELSAKQTERVSTECARAAFSAGGNIRPLFASRLPFQGSCRRRRLRGPHGGAEIYSP